jgi:hypothetical protein
MPIALSSQLVLDTQEAPTAISFIATLTCSGTAGALVSSSVV